MGGRDNQDYYKVAGRTIGDTDATAASRMRLSHQLAELRRESAVSARPPKREKAQPHASDEPRGSRAPPPRRAKGNGHLSVKATGTDKPRHGKKRRSTKKRHEVSVVGELRRHPDESPAEAAYAVRHERPPAEVIDVREGVRRRGAKSAGHPSPAALPNTAPAAERLLAMAEELVRKGRELLIQQTARAVHRLTELVEMPVTAARVIRDIRRRDT